MCISNGLLALLFLLLLLLGTRRPTYKAQLRRCYLYVIRMLDIHVFGERNLGRSVPISNRVFLFACSFTLSIYDSIVYRIGANGKIKRNESCVPH